MPLVRFIETRTVKDGSGLTYEEGKVYDLPQESVDRWVRRRSVEIVDAKTVKKKDISEPAYLDESGEEVAPPEKEEKEEKKTGGKQSPDAMKTSDIEDEEEKKE